MKVEFLEYLECSLQRVCILLLLVKFFQFVFVINLTVPFLLRLLLHNQLLGLWANLVWKVFSCGGIRGRWVQGMQKFSVLSLRLLHKSKIILRQSVFCCFIFKAFWGEFVHLSVCWYWIEFSIWTLLLFFLSSFPRQQVCTKDYGQIGAPFMSKVCIFQRGFFFFPLRRGKWPFLLNTESTRQCVHSSRNPAASWGQCVNSVSHLHIEQQAQTSEYIIH